MPIVPGNDQQPAKKPGSSLFGWIVFLAVFGRPIYNVVRSITNGWISDQQLLILGGGALALIALALIVQRVNRSRQDGAPTFTPPAIPRSNPAASLQQYSRPSDPVLPSTPRFEPIITGKVVLAGVVLALLLLGVGFLFLVTMATP